tara:strand:- start:168 stop:665 length:498 start_codon:yes stop_codon:yes gene_type:complete
MANLNKQGKTTQQCKDSESFISFSIMGILILLLVMLLTSCTGVYYLTDSEYSDVRESHASSTYYDNQIYWGWNSGYYYYYGKPHYYPWYYYYNACPPSHYNTTTHVIITRPVNRPTHRPNRPKVNTHRPNIKVKTNTNRNNKVIIKTNNGSKRTNKTTIRRKPKK